MNDSTPTNSSRSKERLKWLAPIALGMMVVCLGCFCFFSIGLVSRGELTASALGTDFRLWTINDRAQTGVALQRSYGVQQADRACKHFDVTFLLWKPSLSVDSKAYDDCQ
jgi:hypothetical protein